MRLIIKLLLITWVILVGYLLCGSPALAAEIPISRPSDNPQGYASAVGAAHAAIGACTERSILIEYAGGVYRLNGLYFYTVPVTTGNERDVEGYRLALPGKAHLIALYHTHPADLTTDVSNRFSKADLETARNMHVQSFIGVLKSSSVIEYHPMGWKESL